MMIILKLMIKINQEFSQILFKLIKSLVTLAKVYLQYVTIEKMISAHLGLYKQLKCCTITRKKQSIMKTP